MPAAIETLPQGKHDRTREPRYHHGVETATPAQSILLVEKSHSLAGVLARELERHAPVLVAHGLSEAVRLLDSGTVRMIVSAYRVQRGSIEPLFRYAKRQWPSVRRILYAHPDRVSPSGRELAETIIDTSTSFARLHAEIELRLHDNPPPSPSLRVAG